jgi:hypothetical protein
MSTSSTPRERRTANGPTVTQGNRLRRKTRSTVLNSPFIISPVYTR